MFKKLIAILAVIQGVKCQCQEVFFAENANNNGQKPTLRIADDATIGNISWDIAVNSENMSCDNVQRCNLMVWEVTRNLRRFLNGQRFSSGVLTLNPSLLLPGAALILNATITSTTGETIRRCFNIAKRNNLNPTNSTDNNNNQSEDLVLTLVGPHVINRNTELIITALINPYNNSANTTMRWRYQSSESSFDFQYAGTQLKLPPKTFSGGLRFQISCSVLRGPDNLIITEFHTVQVIREGLFVLLLTKNLQVGVNQPIILLSHIEDLDGDSNEIIINWYCVNVNQSNGLCPNFDNRRPTLIINEGFPTAGIYNFTLSAMKNQQIYNETAVITLIEGVQRSVQFSAVSKRVSPLEGFFVSGTIRGLVLGCNIDWVSIPNQLNQVFNLRTLSNYQETIQITQNSYWNFTQITSENSPTISQDFKLQVFAFPPQSNNNEDLRYSIRLQAICPESDGNNSQNIVFSDVELLVNPPPTITDFQVTPQSGQSLLTNFRFTTNQPIDKITDFPLTFEYGFNSSVENTKFLGKYQDYSIFESVLPPSMESFNSLLRICDNKLSCNILRGPDINVTFPQQINEQDIQMFQNIINTDFLRRDYDRAFFYARNLLETVRYLNNDLFFENTNNFFMEIVTNNLQNLLSLQYNREFKNFAMNFLENLISSNITLNEDLIRQIVSLKGKIAQETNAKIVTEEERESMNVLNRLSGNNETLNSFEEFLWYLRTSEFIIDQSNDDSIKNFERRNVLRSLPIFLNKLCKNLYNENDNVNFIINLQSMNIRIEKLTNVSTFAIGRDLLEINNPELLFSLQNYQDLYQRGSCLAWGTLNRYFEETETSYLLQIFDSIEQTANVGEIFATCFNNFIIQIYYQNIWTDCTLSQNFAENSANNLLNYASIQSCPALGFFRTISNQNNIATTAVNDMTSTFIEVSTVSSSSETNSASPSTDTTTSRNNFVTVPELTNIITESTPIISPTINSLTSSSTETTSETVTGNFVTVPDLLNTATESIPTSTIVNSETASSSGGSSFVTVPDLSATTVVTTIGTSDESNTSLNNQTEVTTITSFVTVPDLSIPTGTLEFGTSTEPPISSIITSVASSDGSIITVPNNLPISTVSTAVNTESSENTVNTVTVDVSNTNSVGSNFVTVPDLQPLTGLNSETDATTISNDNSAMLTTTIISINPQSNVVTVPNLPVLTVSANLPNATTEENLTEVPMVANENSSRNYDNTGSSIVTVPNLPTLAVGDGVLITSPAPSLSTSSLATDNFDNTDNNGNSNSNGNSAITVPNLNTLAVGDNVNVNENPAPSLSTSFVNANTASSLATDNFENTDSNANNGNSIITVPNLPTLAVGDGINTTPAPSLATADIAQSTDSSNTNNFVTVPVLPISTNDPNLLPQTTSVDMGSSTTIASITNNGSISSDNNNNNNGVGINSVVTIPNLSIPTGVQSEATTFGSTNSQVFFANNAPENANTGDFVTVPVLAVSTIVSMANPNEETTISVTDVVVQEATDLNNISPDGRVPSVTTSDLNNNPAPSLSTSSIVIPTDSGGSNGNGYSVRVNSAVTIPNLSIPTGLQTENTAITTENSQFTNNFATAISEETVTGNFVTVPALASSFITSSGSSNEGPITSVDNAQTMNSVITTNNDDGNANGNGISTSSAITAPDLPILTGLSSNSGNNDVSTMISTNVPLSSNSENAVTVPNLSEVTEVAEITDITTFSSEIGTNSNSIAPGTVSNGGNSLNNVITVPDLLILTALSQENDTEGSTTLSSANTINLQNSIGDNVITVPILPILTVPPSSVNVNPENPNSSNFPTTEGINNGNSESLITNTESNSANGEVTNQENFTGTTLSTTRENINQEQTVYNEISQRTLIVSSNETNPVNGITANTLPYPQNTNLNSPTNSLTNNGQSLTTNTDLLISPQDSNPTTEAVLRNLTTEIAVETLPNQNTTDIIRDANLVDASIISAGDQISLALIGISLLGITGLVIYSLVTRRNQQRDEIIEEEPSEEFPKYSPVSHRENLEG